MVTLDYALEVVMQLPYQQKQTLLEVLQQRQIEERRDEIAANARQAVQAFQAGALREESVEELIARLHASVEAQDG